MMKLSQIARNAENPREISQGKFDALVLSILAFPKMLELRPIVVDELNQALGGNMRKAALDAIAAMPVEELRQRLRSMSAMPFMEREGYVRHWVQWQASPEVPVISVLDMDEVEKRQFIIKDNLSYGEWDWDKLANEYDSDMLQEWGMDVWSFKEPEAESNQTEQAAWSKEINDESEYFSVTLQFPKDYESKFNDYFRTVGKDYVVNRIVEIITEEEDGNV